MASYDILDMYQLSPDLMGCAVVSQEAAMAIREDGSYPRMDKLLHEVPTRDTKGDDALPLGALLHPSDIMPQLP